MEIQKIRDIFNPTDLEKKHMPVIERLGEGRVLVKVGIIPHVMEKEHYIEWIELYQNNELLERRNLNPGDLPEAEFLVEDLKEEEVLIARELCNLHGLWESI